MEIEFDVVCEMCGESLEVEYKSYFQQVVVDPCEVCVEELADKKSEDDYDRGYEAGYDAGLAAEEGVRDASNKN